MCFVERAARLAKSSRLFLRIEFHHRGSPLSMPSMGQGHPRHLGAVNTPEGIERLRRFADSFVSCLKHHGGLVPRTDHDLDPLCGRPPSPADEKARQYDLNRAVQRVQQHVCSLRSSCQRNGKCRFNFPKAVVAQTQVTRTESGSGVKITFELKLSRKRICSALTQLNSTPPLIGSFVSRTNRPTKDRRLVSD
jgi:hypothetical protein